MAKYYNPVLVKLSMDSRHYSKAFRHRRDSILSTVSPLIKTKLLQALDEIKKLIPEELSQYEKLSLLYQMLTRMCRYDTAFEKRLRHNLISAFRDRVAVCIAYAELFTLLAGSIAGCDIYTVIGYSDPNKMSKEDTRHAWNLVVLPEGTYHLDVTWDLGRKNPTKYRWFLRSDDQMPRVWIKEKYQPAPHPFAGKIYQNETVLEALCTYFERLGPRFQNGIYTLTAD